MLDLFQQEAARLDNDKCTLYFYQFPYIRTSLITHLKFPNIIIVPTFLSVKKRKTKLYLATLLRNCIYPTKISYMEN